MIKCLRSTAIHPDSFSIRKFAELARGLQASSLCSDWLELDAFLTNCRDVRRKNGFPIYGTELTSKRRVFYLLTADCVLGFMDWEGAGPVSRASASCHRCLHSLGNWVGSVTPILGFSGGEENVYSSTVPKLANQEDHQGRQSTCEFRDACRTKYKLPQDVSC